MRSPLAAALLGSVLAACSSSYDSPSSSVPTENDPESTSSSKSRDAGTRRRAAVVDAGKDSVPITPVAAADAGTAAAADDDACTNAGDAVYAFENGSSAWRYSTDPTVPTGFEARGVAFRAAPKAAAEAVPLYLLKNEANGDYLVSTVSTEGVAIGYGPLAILGHIYLEELPGTVPLVRYLQESPALRHLVSIDGVDAAGWSAEPARGFVCPR